MNSVAVFESVVAIVNRMHSYNTVTATMVGEEGGVMDGIKSSHRIDLFGPPSLDTASAVKIIGRVVCGAVLVVAEGRVTHEQRHERERCGGVGRRCRIKLVPGNAK